MLARVFNLIGLAFSAVTVLAIIYWGISLNDLQVEELPVIKALEGEIRVKPEKESSHYSAEELSVDSLISGSYTLNSEKDITLAPKEGSLSNDESNVTIAPVTDSLDLSEAISDALKQVLNEEDFSDSLSQNGEFKIVFAETKSKTEVKDFYTQLLLSFNDELSGIPYEIENVTIDGSIYHRLILRGFRNKTRAKELRSFLSKNGIKSEISAK